MDALFDPISSLLFHHDAMISFAEVSTDGTGCGTRYCGTESQVKFWYRSRPHFKQYQSWYHTIPQIPSQKEPQVKLLFNKIKPQLKFDIRKPQLWLLLQYCGSHKHGTTNPAISVNFMAVKYSAAQAEYGQFSV